MPAESTAARVRTSGQARAKGGRRGEGGGADPKVNARRHPTPTRARTLRGRPRIRVTGMANARSG
eukprot:3367283-Alexandrium_andersonii.AAC.1